MKIANLDNSAQNDSAARFHGLFVGVDRYADQRILWLSGAVRDAKALHALFSDTLIGESHLLLADEDATLEGIRTALDSIASTAEEDDIVVVFYAGHGSETHEIICYDTDVADIPGTALSLEALSETLSRIPGKTVLCALDCCFSGGLGSRVFATGLKQRSMLRSTQQPALDRFIGKGRLVLTASADDEPALESSRHGHGLFTFRLLEALQGVDEVRVNEQVDLQKLVHYVTTHVVADALQMGEVQTPTMRGQLDGVPLWPMLKIGDTYAALFPDRVRQPVSEDPASLLPFGIPQTVLDVWASNITHLNVLQISAVNDYGVLDNENVVVTAPTSSGKTMIGELAAIKSAATRGRTVFLLPMKALVNDKYEYFNRVYGPIGFKTIRATGDYSDHVAELMRGQFDFALLTYEKFRALALANPHLLKMLSVVVVDEAQTLTDDIRGSNLEFLMTVINNKRGQDGSPQMITLSAVVGDLGGLERWIGGRNLHSDKRPVPLREGVLDWRGNLRFLDETGEERTEASFIQPLYVDGSRSTVIPLVRKLMAEGKKVIVFRQTKGEAAACATYLAADLGLAAATAVLEDLAAGEPSASTVSLRRTLSGGVGFHTADLDRTERRVLEDAFRRPASGLDVIVATPTLAMGVNTPATAVIIVGLTHPGPIPKPYTVASYKNMVGRAGRLGLAESGESYLVPEGQLNPARAWTDYVLGQLEPLVSKLVPDGDPRTLMLGVLARYEADVTGCVSEEDVVGFLDSSFAAFQERQGGNPQWDARQLHEAFQDLVDARLIEQSDQGFRLTSLGRFTGESGVHVDSIIRLADVLRHIDGAALKSTGLVAAAQLTKELDGVYMQINLRGKTAETSRWSSVLLQQDIPPSLVNALQNTAPEGIKGAVQRAKRASAAIYWINGIQLSDVESALNQAIWSRPSMAGTIRAVTDRTRDLLPAVAAVLQELNPEATETISSLAERTVIRLEFGVTPDLVDLAGSTPSLGRPQLLALKAADITSPQAVTSKTIEQLAEIVGSEQDAEQLLTSCAEFITRQDSTSIALPKPTE
ncbi:DEAD/DEAH box helicase [Nocardia beijingensis]